MYIIQYPSAVDTPRFDVKPVLVKTLEEAKQHILNNDTWTSHCELFLQEIGDGSYIIRAWYTQEEFNRIRGKEAYIRIFPVEVTEVDTSVGCHHNCWLAENEKVSCCADCSKKTTNHNPINIR